MYSRLGGPQRRREHFGVEKNFLPVGNPTTTLSRLGQRSLTGGPRTNDGPRENFGGPWRNLTLFAIFMFIILFHYILIRLRVLFQTSSNKYHTNNFVIIKQAHFILIKWKFYDHYFIDVCTFLKRIHVSGPWD
jgi:hypothetical protein